MISFRVILKILILLLFTISILFPLYSVHIKTEPLSDFRLKALDDDIGKIYSNRHYYIEPINEDVIQLGDGHINTNITPFLTLLFILEMLSFAASLTLNLLNRSGKWSGALSVTGMVLFVLYPIIILINRNDIARGDIPVAGVRSISRGDYVISLSQNFTFLFYLMTISIISLAFISWQSRSAKEEETFDIEYDRILTILITVGLSMISIVVIIFVLAKSGADVPFSDLYDYGIKEVFWSERRNDTNYRNIFNLLFWSTPLVLTALSVAIAFKAGLFNIGGQGQFMVGAGVSAIWALIIIPGNSIFNSQINNPWFMIPTTIVAGFIGGGIWGFIPGYLRAKYGAHEVITTILMNLVAISLTNYWFTSPGESPYVDTSRTDAYGQSAQIPESARFIPVNSNYSTFFNWSFVIIIAIVIISYILISHTKFGYKIRAVGKNEIAAKTSGIKSERVIMMAMLLSGGIAGIAGALFVMGKPPFRYVLGMESTYGFDGIAISLMGANNPFGILIAAIFFGYLTQAGLLLKLRGTMPSEIVLVFQSFIILFAAAPVISDKLLKLSRKGFKQTQHLLEKEDKPPEKHKTPEDEAK